MSKAIQVSRTLAEALSLANTKAFEKGMVDNKFKIHGTIEPNTNIIPSTLQQYMRASFGDGADEMAIFKEVQNVTRAIALNSQNKISTSIEYVAQ